MIPSSLWNVWKWVLEPPVRLLVHVCARSGPKWLHGECRTSGDTATTSQINKGCFCSFICKPATGLDITLSIKAPSEFFWEESNEFPAKNETMRFGFAFKLSVFVCVWGCLQAAYETLLLLLVWFCFPSLSLVFLVCTWEKTPQGGRQSRTTPFSVCTRCKWQVQDAHLRGLSAVTQTLSVRKYWHRKPLQQDIPYRSQKSVSSSPGQRQEMTLQCSISFQAVKEELGVSTSSHN